jgi:2-methoxy-6-polyprenyl-1,4-benzoquinol methylase
VKGVFDNVASDYDLMNDIMSGTLHRHWKDEFVSMLRPECLVRKGGVAEEEAQTEPPRILDVAGGTGDIAFRICDAIAAAQPRAADVESGAVVLPPPVEVTVCDINRSMLDVGERRASERYPTGAPMGTTLSFAEGNAERLEAVPDASVDAYTIGFGIRNVSDIERALREAHRVLRPGGRFMCLEFSRVRGDDAGLLRRLYEAYSFNVIPSMGTVIAGDRDSYQYLVESIAKFPPQEQFAKMIEDAGFSLVRHEDMTFGVVAVHSGFKL